MAAEWLNSVEQFDVIIIGAGISGIGAASYLRRELPGKSVSILEARGSIGGTWDLFRYPGIRSDSDLHTFGYEFKPWRHENAIADAPLIRDYLKETVQENALTSLIRLRHRVVDARWDSADARWTLAVEVTDEATGQVTGKTLRAGWVFAATGYYRYDEGFTPKFPGQEDFSGSIVHPQHWPENFDYSGKRVVVIGSGATAITLLPSMAKGPGAASHVTMLQRTPSYVVAMPRIDTIALALSRFFGEQRGYALSRFKNIWLDRLVVKFLRGFPRLGRRLIRWHNISLLPKGFEVDKHFNPPYDPWDQRLCLAPDGDFFKALSSGAASIVTDTITRFTPRGILLGSGEEIPADVIVTATGLNMRLFDGMPISVDGKRMDIAQSVSYRGMLLSGIPNWAIAIGYTTSSWTLKVGLMSRYFIDLLKHMDDNGYDQALAVAEPGMTLKPIMDLQAGYAKRGASLMPKQGESKPWRMAMSYPEDAKAIRGPVADKHLQFSRRDATETRFAGRGAKAHA